MEKENNCNQSPDQDLNTTNGCLITQHKLVNNLQFSDSLVDKIRLNYCEFYKQHILNCSLFTNSLNLRNNHIMILNKVEHLNAVNVKPSVIKTITNHNKWMIDLVKTLPFFVYLSDSDFMQVIYKSQILTFAFKIAEFKTDYESYLLYEDNIWYSRKLMLKLLGDQGTSQSFELFKKINAFKMNERERALFYLYILCECDGILFV